MIMVRLALPCLQLVCEMSMSVVSSAPDRNSLGHWEPTKLTAVEITYVFDGDPMWVPCIRRREFQKPLGVPRFPVDA